MDGLFVSLFGGFCLGWLVAAYINLQRSKKFKEDLIDLIERRHQQEKELDKIREESKQKC